MLKKAKTKKITAKVAIQKKYKSKNYVVKTRFESNNKKVATISKNGKIKAVKKGTCKIYVFAQNGLSKTVTIKVK